MKINHKIYQKVKTQPYEIQEFENFQIELHSLNSNEELYQMFVPKGKMAVWSSYDGINYRLLIEDGYYGVLKDLYSKEVNCLWTDYYNQIEVIKRKNFFVFFIPMLVLTVVGALLIPRVFSENAGSAPFIFFMLILIALIMFNNGRLSRMMKLKNQEYYRIIREHVGEDYFDELMKVQRAYFDKFYGYEPLDEEEKTSNEEILSEYEKKAHVELEDSSEENTKNNNEDIIEEEKND